MFIYALLMALDIQNNQMPPFGSTITFELHQQNSTNLNLDWDESNSIKIFYLNETETNNPHLLKIPACSETEICTVRQFKKQIFDLILTPEQWIEECEFKANTINQSKLGNLILRLFFQN